MTRVGRCVRRATCVLVVLLALPVAALAETSGALRGTVADDKGTALPGAVVAVSSVGHGVAGRAAVTDASGEFLIQALPPAGDYQVRVSMPGYATVVLSGVEVSAGRVRSVRLALSPETAVRQRVEVRASPSVVDLEDTSTQTRLSSEFIDTLPILGRDYQDALTLAPGVTDVDGDGNPNIHGARDTDVVTLVDGVSTTDPLTGKVGAQLNIESIQEIEIKTSGATAEFGRAQGGFADIVTKSGGNEFQGTVKFFWRGSALDGDGAGIDDPRLHAGVGEIGLRTLRFNDYLPFLAVSGRIARDRAWFYLANEYISREDPVNALNAAFVRGVHELREFLKLTWQASAAHRLALSINYDPQEYSNQGLNSFTREESGYTSRLGGTVLTFKSTAVLSPVTALETSVSAFDQSPRVEPNIGPDSNGNGVLWLDRNGNGFMEASERDPGEDYNGDGVFNVFEDTNGNSRLDPGEDQDGDGNLSLRCEGLSREDVNCNGRLDPGEDRNNNKTLDDTPRPASLYPYGRLAPWPADRDYNIDRNTGLITGPYYENLSDQRRRFTFRQDLSLYVPDFQGSHDLKMGLDLEREGFTRQTRAREITSPYVRTCQPPLCEKPDAQLENPFARPQRPVDTISALLPTSLDVQNDAVGLTAGFYVQDAYHPVPNLSLGFGLRFDRERAEAPGYTSFDPALEAQNFDRLLELGGFRVDQGSAGVLADPIFHGGASIIQSTAFLRDPLQVAALSRLTRHHAVVGFESTELTNLGIVPDESEGSLDELTVKGVTPQTAQTFAITNNNLAPRLSVSWDPVSDGRTKLFATWGRYFDKLFLSTIVGEQGPDWVNRYYRLDQDNLMSNGTPDHGIGPIISKAPPSATQVDRNLATPYSDEFTLGFEREIAPEVAVSLTYINRRFRDQLQDIDINHALRFDSQGHPLDAFGNKVYTFKRNSIDFSSAKSAPDGRPDLYIRDFFFNQILRVGNFNDARYRGIELALTRRLARRWQMQASYTYSRAVGSAEDFESRLGNDPSTVESEFGYLDYDQRHVVKLNAAVFLPRDWQVGTSMSWSSGLPYSIISRFFALDNVGYEQFRTTYGYTVLDPGRGLRFVPLHRNSERNAAVLDINLQARKNVVIGRHAASVSVEIFNLLNRDDLRIFTFEPAVTDLNTLSNTTNPTPGGPLQINGERRFGRRIQLGIRYEF